MKLFFFIFALKLILIKSDDESSEFVLHMVSPYKTISKYSLYRDVSIINFEIPINTKTAKFSLKAVEQRCEPKPITIHLKAGSFPVISPQNISFPQDYLRAENRNTIFNSSMISDDNEKDIIIEGPIPGNWFLIAFKNWTNPKNDKIEQQGLSKSCITKLKAELYIKKVDTIELSPGVLQHHDDKSYGFFYDFFVPEGVDNATITIDFLNLFPINSKMDIYIRPRGLPSSTNYLHKFQIVPQRSVNFNLSFYVHAACWHYVAIEDNFTNATYEYSIALNYNISSDYLYENDYGYKIERFRDIQFFRTFRKNHRDFFLFDIDVTDRNGTSPDYFNFTGGVNYGFRFNIFDTQDIGGMLTALIGLINLKDTMRLEKPSEKIIVGPDTIYDQNSIPKPEKLVELNPETIAESNTTVDKIAIICLHLNEPGVPEWPSYCRYGDSVRDADAIINNSNRTQSINVPFPEAGEWYLTTKIFCVVKENNTDYNSMTNEFINCNGTFVVGLGSVPCEFNQCGPYGSCYHYMSGGFVYTTCVCKNGYRGWDCTDDTDVTSLKIILFATLLLTLSNLLFIPSVYFAFRRQYYVEALIYFFTMFFSSFYHACDAGEDIYSFCLVRLGVLQFCDFYCGLLAIYVTLIAMANISPQYVPIAHMLGAILLAFGTEYDKQSLTVFLAPALTGICLFSVCWIYRCKKTKKLYPSKKYLTIFLPIGAILVMVGLICYAFLQTKQNYHIIHSIWHMVMALSILLLLPNKHIFLPK